MCPRSLLGVKVATISLSMEDPSGRGYSKNVSPLNLRDLVAPTYVRLQSKMWKRRPKYGFQRGMHRVRRKLKGWQVFYHPPYVKGDWCPITMLALRD